MIVNETLAESLWPGQEPIGNVLETNGRQLVVIGVVSEARYFSLERSSGPEMYLPIRQQPDYNSLDLVVRTSNSPADLAPSIRQVLRSIDPNLPVTEFRAMEQLVDRSTFARRFVVSLIGGFALFGLVLAALGIYALVSYSVTQRRQEIGIRLALGASAEHLQRRILTETLALVALGLLPGLIGSWIAARAMESLLFEVQSSDLATFAAVLLLLALSAAVAGYLPARRAAKLNPLDALRAD